MASSAARAARLGPPLAVLPYPILRGLSRPRDAALRLAPGRAARAVGTAWPPAGGAGGHAPEGAAQKCLLNFLSAVDALKEKSEKYSKRHISCSEIDALVYVNLRGTCLARASEGVETEVVETENLDIQGWRSVSIVIAPYAVVLTATSTAPKFIRERVGQILNKWPHQATSAEIVEILIGERRVFFAERCNSIIKGLFVSNVNLKFLECHK